MELKAFKKEVADKHSLLGNLDEQGQHLVHTVGVVISVFTGIIGSAVAVSGWIWLFTIDWRIAVAVVIAVYGFRATTDICLGIGATILAPIVRKHAIKKSHKPTEKDE